jgi:hypothetical protein
VAGREREARARLARLEARPADRYFGGLYLAEIQIARGNPRFDRLGADPRFVQLVQRVAADVLTTKAVGETTARRA